MADAILMAGGTGGVSSDDVTASKAQVLQGYKTVTRDSDDEIVEGTIPNRGNGMESVELMDAHWENKYVFRMEQGFYAQIDQWKPYVSVPYAVLSNFLHVDANKMLDNLTISGIKGTIPIRGYHGPDSAEMWLYLQEGGYVIRLEEGYYHTDDGSGLKPYVIVPTHIVKNAVGYRADKTLNDTVVCGEQGAIPIRGNVADTVEFVNAHWESKFLARMEQGFYSQNGQYKPCVAIPYAVLANAAGVDANKMLDTLTVAGIRGIIPNRGTWNMASEVVNAPWENNVHTKFEEGYYPKDGYSKPTAKIPYALLVNALGIDSSKMLDTLTVAGKQGQIKSIDTAASNFRINKSTSFGIDNWTNPSNPVFYVDFPHGNGYYNRSDGHPHVCIDAINLGDVTADKVMRGFTATSKNGVKFAGTMPDLQSGRTVFNGATFDNVLVSGVATKGFDLNGTYFAHSLDQNYGYAGIYNGGMNFNLSTGYPALKSRRIGCVLSQSINLTPFRQIIISYRTLANIQGNPYATLEAHVNRVSTRRLIYVAGAGNVDAIDVLRQGTASPAIDRNSQIVLNVADINEQAFISFGAYCNSDRSSDVFAGPVQITKIDFLN